MSVADLARLQALAALRLDLKLEALRRQSEAIESLREELADATLSGERAQKEDPALAARHEAWVRQRRQALNLQLARHLVAHDEAHRDAATAFGQREALTRIAERAKDEVRLRQSRRT